MIRLLAILAALFAFVPGAVDAAGPPAPDLRTARVVDLTHPFDEHTPYWPTATSGFKLERLHYGQTPGGFFYSAYSFCAPEHGGTHLDAPIHFAEGRWTADQIPVDRLVRPAVVIDVAAAAAADADHRLTVGELTAWEARHGRIPAGTIVLLRTGWSARWPDRKRYLGDDTPGDASRLRFPSYGRGGGADPGGGPQGGRPRGRHREHRSRVGQGLSRAPGRGRRQRARVREPHRPRRAAPDRGLGRRPAHEDRGRVGRPAPGHRPRALSRLRQLSCNQTPSLDVQVQWDRI